jgi:hypothetical protein
MSPLNLKATTEINDQAITKSTFYYYKSLQISYRTRKKIGYYSSKRYLYRKSIGTQTRKQVFVSSNLSAKTTTTGTRYIL